MGRSAEAFADFGFAVLGAAVFWAGTQTETRLCTPPDLAVLYRSGLDGWVLLSGGVVST